MVYTHRWGDVTENTATVSHPGGYVYSQNIKMPVGNIARNGRRPIAIFGIAAGYATGASGISTSISYYNTITGGSRVFPESGGTFEFRIGYQGGTLRFGRDLNQGGLVRTTGAGNTWQGILAGQLDYSMVTSAPRGLSVTMDGTTLRAATNAPEDLGGNKASDISYAIEYQFNGGAWGNRRMVKAGEVTTYTAVTPGLYRFRTFSISAAGESPEMYSGNLTVANGINGAIRRWDNGSFVPISAIRRWNGNSWENILTKRRWTGEVWVYTN